MGVKAPLMPLYPRTRQGRANSHTYRKPARRQQTACSSTPAGCRVGPLIIGLLDSLFLPDTCQPVPADPWVGASVSHHNESTLEQLPFLLEPCWRKAGQGKSVSCPPCLPRPALAALLSRVHTSQPPSFPSSSVCLDFPGKTSDTAAWSAPLRCSKPT